jgi:hypothetical protein
MAPKKWTTPEQEKFLQSFLSEYQTHSSKKDYSQFWPVVQQKFFTEWPPRKVLFPDKPEEEELTESERVLLSDGIKKRKEVGTD